MLSISSVRGLLRQVHTRLLGTDRQRGDDPAERLLHEGRYAEAEQWLSSAIAASGDLPPRARIDQLLLLAEAQRKQSKVAEASQSVQRARQAAGTDRAEYARCLDHWAILAMDQGAYAEARRLLLESLQIEESFDPPHPAILAVRTYRLATAESKAGDRASALERMRAAVGFYERAFGPEHGETGRRILELADMCRQSCDWEEARKLTERALSIHERVYGPNSKEAIADLQQLAKLRETAREPGEAAKLYEKAIQRQSARNGGSNAELAGMMLSLAKLYIGWAEYDRAEEMLPRLLPMLEREADQGYAAALTMAGMLQERRGNHGAAEESYRRALSYWESRPGEYTVELVQTLERLATVLETLQQHGEAVDLRAQAQLLRLSDPK